MKMNELKVLLVASGHFNIDHRYDLGDRKNIDLMLQNVVIIFTGIIFSSDFLRYYVIV